MKVKYYINYNETIIVIVKIIVKFFYIYKIEQRQTNTNTFDKIRKICHAFDQDKARPSAD